MHIGNMSLSVFRLNIKLRIILIKEQNQELTSISSCLHHEKM